VTRGERPTVVLLHGLARRKGSLAALGRFLQAAGYPTWAHTYPSRRLPIAEAAAAVGARIAAELGGRPLAAVTHSLGGILLRHLHDDRLRFERIVMLAPPNRGSRVASAFAENPLFRWFYGPAGREVIDASEWPGPPAPFAIVAGTKARALGNPTSWFSGGILEGPNDGTLLVAETELEGAAAFATVAASHTWIMNDRTARTYVLEFLETGRLSPQRASRIL
jgi:hypothetical protein